jgi:hypothetical protein
LDIVVQVVNGLTELSQRTTEPVCPLKVNVPLVDPEQIVAPPLTLPPTEVGDTVTVVAVAVSGVQEALCTSARNCVVCVNAPEVYVVVVLEIVVQVVNGDTALSQLTTEPVCPLKVNVPLVEPEQMDVPPLTLPPTDAGFTVTVVADEVAEAHEPLCTTARNCVVWVRAPEVYVVVVLAIVVQVVNGLTELSQRTTEPV